MDKRLVDLEVRYTYMERALSELDAVVVELRGQIDALRLRVTRLEEVARGSGEETPPNERPPHY